MAYTKQTWVNGAGGGTPISADRLTHIEDGIDDADTRLDAVDLALDAVDSALDDANTRLDDIDTELDTVPGSITAAIANLVDTAPATLDTLNELAAALGDDVNFSTTVTNLIATKQPLDSDLTAIAALTTTSYGRAFLALADAAAGRTALELGTASTSASTDFQPIDSDLSAIAALTTTSFGRALLALADAAALRTAAGLGTAATSASTDFQPIDSDLTAIAALTTTSFGRALLALADAAALRTAAGLGTAATSASTDFQPIDSDLTAIAALTTTSYGRAFLALADAAAGRTALGLGTAATSASADFQPVDSDLTAIAALVSAANKLAYATGAGTWSLTDLTAFARTLLDDADATTALSTLGAQPLDSDLTAIAALASAANKLPYATGSGTWSLTDLSAFARTLIDDADAATALATLGAQPLDSDLTSIAALTTTSYGRAFLALADAAAARTALSLGTMALETATNYMVIVNHGATAGTARPSGAAAVYWIGSVTPSNAQSQDLFYDTDG